MAKFSIIIPVYNVAPWLHECLGSVLRQTCPDWEAICVDDGSTDGSGVILDNYATSDTRIRVWHRVNSGVSAARNFAMQQATGDWIMFVDADDILPTSAIEYYNSAISSGADMISGEAVEFQDGNRPIFNRSDAVCRVVDWDGYAELGCHKRNLWQACYRRNIIGNMMFMVGVVMGEDREFQSRIYGRCCRFGVIDAPVYGYRIRGTSAMQSKLTPKKLIDRLEMALLVSDNLRKTNRKTPATERRFSAFNLTEFVAIDYFRLSRIERKGVHPVWQKAIRSVFVDKNAPAWCRFASLVVLCLPFDFIRRIVFWIPMSLKQKGFHR